MKNALIKLGLILKKEIVFSAASFSSLSVCSSAFAYFFRLKASLIFFLFLAPGRSSTKQ